MQGIRWTTGWFVRRGGERKTEFILDKIAVMFTENTLIVFAFARNLHIFVYKIVYVRREGL